MKKLIYTLLTLSILFTIGCGDKEKEEVFNLDDLQSSWVSTEVELYTDDSWPENPTYLSSIAPEEAGDYMALNIIDVEQGNFSFNTNWWFERFEYSDFYSVVGGNADSKGMKFNIEGQINFWKYDEVDAETTFVNVPYDLEGDVLKLGLFSYNGTQRVGVFSR